MASHLKSEAESLQRGVEMGRSIDEERGLLDLLFLAEFAEKQHGELCSPGLKQPDSKEFVRVGIDSGVQPVALIVDSNHRFVQRDLIRGSVACRL
jgi:hypothetical protein